MSVLAAAQLTRAVEQREGKRPVLSDLRESGSLEQDSDIVMFIHRADKDDKDMAQPQPRGIHRGEAHRNGPTHSGIELVFLEKLAKFENAGPARMMTQKKRRGSVPRYMSSKDSPQARKTLYRCRRSFLLTLLPVIDSLGELTLSRCTRFGTLPRPGEGTPLLAI